MKSTKIHLILSINRNSCDEPQSKCGSPKGWKVLSLNNLRTMAAFVRKRLKVERIVFIIFLRFRDNKKYDSIVGAVWLCIGCREVIQNECKTRKKNVWIVCDDDLNFSLKYSIECDVEKKKSRFNCCEFSKNEIFRFSSSLRRNSQSSDQSVSQSSQRNGSIRHNSNMSLRFALKFVGNRQMENHSRQI